MLVNKKNFWIIISILYILMFFPSLEVDATEDVDLNYEIEIDTYGNGEYAITQYKVDMVVNEDNSYDITEYIGVYFNEAKHGIIREIPKKNTIIRSDGSKTKNRAKIKGIHVNEEFSKASNSEGITLKIGSPDYTVIDFKEYIISYKYEIGSDEEENFDELYFNLIGNDWDTTISNVEFSITMPKEFDESKLGFYSGLKGSTDDSLIIYEIEDSIKIKGKYLGVLKAREGLTIRLELPEGYYSTKIMKTSEMLMLFLPIILLLITYILYLKNGKDDRRIETVEFYPPLDYNSAETGLLYRGKAEDKDVISLLIYLANKGYILIDEEESDGVFSSEKSFSVIKLKDYDGNNYYEKKFLEGLFKDGKEVVTATDLRNDFHTTVSTIKDKLNDKKNIDKIFEEKSLKIGKIIIPFVILIYVITSIVPLYENGATDLILPVIIFVTIGFTVLIFSILHVKENNPLGIFGIIWGTFFGGIPFTFMLLPSLIEKSLYLFAYIIGLVCIVAMMKLKKIMPKRTDHANKVLGKINGFKRFLKVAEKSKLEALVMDNPTYFYDILPYTYVLDVSDKWINKFETINMQSPDWYQSHTTSTFNIYSFNQSINNTMKVATSSMTGDRSSGGSSGGFSGGSSGGGSSGGGSGGGGGSSW